MGTNHLSQLVTLNHPLHQWILVVLHAGHTFAVTVPALVEIW